MAKRKLFEEAMKAAEKALKIKDPDKRNYAMNQAAKKAVQGDPKAFRGKMVAGKAKKAKLTRPQKSGTKAERAERAAELRELREQRPDNIKELRFKAGGALKAPANPGLKKLPTKVRNKMGYMKSGGKVTSKCKRDGIAIRGRTKGRMV
tara:strand:- start:68 stop:514 length:447 start_codon:yes stop_codon:yes gene_type:complete